ncbi:MAG: phage tail sheath family protein [Clostridia bacterium]|nr:phage tail sheath family protein [Clostridia bacterium]
MALGGGTFTNYNKVLPGTYVNFVSALSASGEVSERGVCAVAIELDWGVENEFFAVTADDFYTDSMKIFGYAYTHSKMRCMRDLFLNASKVYVYRLGEGVKAEGSFAKARYSGICGNNIKIRVSENIDDNSYFDVATYYSNVKRDVQKVKSAAELKDNDYVIWDTAATLEVCAATALTGGSNATVTGENYQSFLDKCENISFNVLAVASTDDNVNSLIAAYTKRMREERGVKFQSVLYKTEADDIGVINVDTSVNDKMFNTASFVWFVAGAAAGCEIYKSLTNRVYNGVFELIGSYTQADLEAGIKKGKFIAHKVDDEWRILADINSLVTTTAEMGEVFCENQTVRIIDQIACDDANLFKNKYLGMVPNDEAGRVSLWNDITEHRKSLVKMRAIEPFKDEDIEVKKGNNKTSVVILSKICPINSMTQLYISTTVE